ncbi:zinc-dependent metalloprotease [Micrococcoides hystricis]|uniref:Zinc-dependent metalloprotease n=1 Tax=Micrococcoides hystricis TaxID=1572761 RepID=A0ABV6PB73_9MICC
MNSAQPSLINWSVAEKTAVTMVGAGPKLDRAAIADEVALIRQAAEDSVGHVQNITGLDVHDRLEDSPTLVSDRATWIKANIEGFKNLLTPVLTEVVARKPDSFTETNLAIGGAGSGVEMGMILAFLGDKVLGQFEPFCALGEGPTGGRLVLVAPNIVKVREELNVDAHDFAMWVCLHEQTHRVQFAAAPWLRGHMATLIRGLSSSLFASAGDMGTRLKDALLGTKQELESGTSSTEVEDLPGKGIRKVLNEDEARMFSELTAIMSLMEGHANVVMDAVDSSIVSSVKTIRRRFTKRSENLNAVEKFLRKLIGMDTKMRQYQDGQKFVQAVVDEVGMDKFNMVWGSPQNMPTETEIHNPSQWIARVVNP